jgi:homocysteine S-methyltransferase
MRPFLEAIDEQVLVADGAMGTMLYAKGIFVNKCFDALNLTQPDLVAEVHQAYVRAGADLLETNTFGANRVKLASFGAADKLHAINVRGARIARHASRDAVYVAGAIGPLGIRIEPWGKTGVDEAEAYFREQAAALLEGGVDLFILETFRDLNEISAAIAAVRGLCDLPVVAQMTTEEDGNSLDGTPPERFAPELERRGAHVIGLNCSVGPAPMLETIERMSAVTTLKLSAQPNGGMPRQIEGRTIYLSSPEYMASYARRFIARGVRLVGGCCGTTPDHIRQIKAAVRVAQPAIARERLSVKAAHATAVVEAPSVALGDKSRLAHALARKKPVTIVELAPPRGHECAETLEHARMLKIRGVDAINVPDGPGSGRMSALSTAVLIEQQAGIETVLHYACRDRNLMGMQSDLLGAHAMGVRNLLVVTGDPPKLGDYAMATAVFDVDSIGLTNVVTRLNRGVDVGDGPIGRATCFHVGVAVNPTAVQLDEELRRFQYKLEAGAEFVVTNAVFDPCVLDALLQRTGPLEVPIIASVWVIDSLLNAEYLANEVPGTRVPEHVLDRMRQAEADGRAAEEGVAIACEIAVELRRRAQGLQIRTTSGQIQAALSVVDALV